MQMIYETNNLIKKIKILLSCGIICLSVIWFVIIFWCSLDDFKSPKASSSDIDQLFVMFSRLERLKNNLLTFDPDEPQTYFPKIDNSIEKNSEYLNYILNYDEKADGEPKKFTDFDDKYYQDEQNKIEVALNRIYAEQQVIPNTTSLINESLTSSENQIQKRKIKIQKINNIHLEHVNETLDELNKLFQENLAIINKYNESSPYSENFFGLINYICDTLDFRKNSGLTLSEVRFYAHNMVVVARSPFFKDESDNFSWNSCSALYFYKQSLKIESENDRVYIYIFFWSFWYFIPLLILILILFTFLKIIKWLFLDYKII